MGKVVSVPRLFIKGRYIGGIEELAKLHEHGTLSELLEGLPKDFNGGDACDGCGGARFLPCLRCNGSCKLRKDDNHVSRCPQCNENGLIQCPICT
jgi:glutaredoxin domain-containing cysteine-rich protein 1